MHPSFAIALSAVYSVSICLICCIFPLGTGAAIKRNSIPPIPRSALRNVPHSGVNRTCLPGPAKEHHEVLKGSGKIWPYQGYKSSPFNPPELEITANGKPLAAGLLFISPSDNTEVRATKDTAPLIMTETGQLVWHGPMVDATNFRVASYEGKSILTFWNGSKPSGANVGHGYGQVTFLDSTYKEILTVCPQLGLRAPDNITYTCQADFHESFITDRNTLLVTAYNVTETDLSSIGGPAKGWVFDCLFFELDPKTGHILFRWSALEHVPVSETKLKLAGRGGLNQSVPFDWFHINSVENIGNQFLVNSRHLWTTYLVTAKGDIEWTFQGDTGGDFGVLPPNGHFAWQHYARILNITENRIAISYFNNYNALDIDNGTHPSDGLVLGLALPPNKSDPPVLLDYLSDPNDHLYSGSQGSTTLLPNGHFLLQYGQIPVLKEFGCSGPNGSAVLWTARFGLDNLVQSYRGFKSVWRGFPTSKPDLAVGEDGDGCAVAYVSWNGATDVEGWVVFEGVDESRLRPVGRVGYRGFETEFAVGERCVQVAAVVDGGISTRSSVVCSFSNGTLHG